MHTSEFASVCVGGRGGARACVCVCVCVCVCARARAPRACICIYLSVRLPVCASVADPAVYVYCVSLTIANIISHAHAQTCVSVRQVA